MRVASVASLLVVLTFGITSVAAADPASGTVKTPTGTISPKVATAYVVRDSHQPHQNTVEVLLSETAVDAASLHDALDRHAAAINFPSLRDRDRKSVV